MYEYTEFTEIVMKHFMEKSDHIEEQLQEWTALDPRGTKHHAEEIRNLLQRLRTLVKERQERCEGRVKKDDENSDRGRSQMCESSYETTMTR